MIMKIVQIKLFDTYNTGGLDGQDTGMMFRARVVIPTAADQHQATPSWEKDQDTTVQGPVTSAIEVLLDGELPDGQPHQQATKEHLGQAQEYSILHAGHNSRQILARNYKDDWLFHIYEFLYNCCVHRH